MSILEIIQAKDVISNMVYSRPRIYNLFDPVWPFCVATIYGCDSPTCVHFDFACFCVGFV